MADYWLKLYVEILDDPKMGTLQDRLWRRVVELFLAAKRYNRDGLLPDTGHIAWMLHMDADLLDVDLQEIARTGIIERLENGWRVVHFAERQDRSTAAERKQAQRDRERHQQYEDDTAATEKKINSLTEKEKDWLHKITDAFGEMFANPYQVKTALMIRSQFGEEKGWEAVSYYAGRGKGIGEGVSRAFRALPSWGTYYKDPPSASKPKTVTSPPSTFDVKFAMDEMGWSPEQCRVRMLELGMKQPEIEAQLGGAT